MNFNSIVQLLIILIMNIENLNGILNGDPAAGNDFRYQIFLYNPSGYGCSGVIIDEWHILTAAHCVENFPLDAFAIYAGITNLADNDRILCRIREIHYPSGFMSKAEESTVKQEPNRIPYHDDIAVLTSEETFTLGQRVAAVSLPTHDVPRCGSGWFCTFSGWGPTMANYTGFSWDLTRYEPTILSPDYCARLGAAHGDNEFCALDLLEVSTPLNGDSGGGLVCDGVLVGILATGASSVHIPAIYVNVYNFLTSISEIRERDKDNHESLNETTETGSIIVESTEAHLLHVEAENIH